MLMAPQGLDVLFSKERLEIGRNFMNKLWNACRFISMNKPDDWSEEYSLKPEELKLPDKWILSQLNKAIEKYNHQLERFHFNEAAKVLYDYIWNDFCDWYIEIAKTRFYSEDIDSKHDCEARGSRLAIMLPTTNWPSRSQMPSFIRWPARTATAPCLVCAGAQRLRSGRGVSFIRPLYPGQQLQ